jgi:hypothetical protein
MSTQTEFTWPADSATPVIITKSTTGKENAESHTSIDVVSNPAAGAVGGNSAANIVSNIPRYSSTPKQKVQINNAKPGPASSETKPVLGNEPSKMSADPINIYKKFGSLDAMDLEMISIPKKGSNHRTNH